MATFKFTSTNSVFSFISHAFFADPPGPDTLIVELGGYLIATGGNFSAAFLNPNGAWNVTVNGTMYSHQAYGIVLDINNAGVSKITVGAGGSIGGGITGINAASPVIIKNAGVIAGASGEGISIGGAGVHSITNSGIISGAGLSIVDLDGLGNDTVTNSGLLLGGVNFGGGNNKLVNSGTIVAQVLGSVISAGSGNDTINNSGTISGSTMGLGDGTNKFINSGLINCLGGVFSGSGNDAVVNSKTMTGGINLGDGNNTFTNSGSIGADNTTSVTCGSGNDTVTNTGNIVRSVRLGDGHDTLVNSGMIGTPEDPADVTCGSGNDTVTNFAVVAGVIKNGTITGVVNLSDGDDKFFGGAKTEIVLDGNGSDIVKLAGGNDLFQTFALASGGADTISGGGGRDTYAVVTNNAVQINLDIVAHDQGPFVPGAGFVAANTATGVDIATDTITGFEDASGFNGDDIIYGNAAANELDGSAGGDILNGYGGNDTLVGGPGQDTLFGGAGKDMLSGSSDSDRFQFAKVTDSGVTTATRDVITDFAFGGTQFDIINLAVIDANTTLPGDQAFDYVNNDSSVTPAAEFNKVAGELRSYWTFQGHIIEGDINGDGNPDFAIELLDPTHATTLSDNIFFL